MLKRAFQVLWHRCMQRQVGWRQSSGTRRKQRAHIRPCLEPLEDRTAPAVITVNSVADNNVADNFLTLREAILLVDGTLGRSLSSTEQKQITGTLGNNDTIGFNLASAPQTILLSGGSFAITKPLTITGPGASNLTIDGNNLARVFTVGQDFSQNLSLAAALGGLTISRGSWAYGAGLANFGTLTVSNTIFANNTATANGGGAIYNVGALTLSSCTFSGNSTHGSGSSSSAGGAICNNSAGTATVSNCTFSNNTATGASSGAAINNSGTLTASSSIFSGNTAASNAGGILNSAEGKLTVGTSTFANNSCGSDGAGIDNDGTATVNSCTFLGNSAGSEGGGLANQGSFLGLTNCTLYGNSAVSDGGGLETSKPATLTSCTITANRASSGASGVFGGGIYDVGIAAKVFNTIVAGNFKGPTSGNTADDIAGGNMDGTSAFNLIGSGGSGGLTNGVNNNQVGVSTPGLGSLASNGGPTQTISLLLGSPAVDKGSNGYVTSGQTDQRGLTRIVHATVDIGAFELQMTSIAPADQSSNQGVATWLNLGSFADANSTAGPWSVDVNWGDTSQHGLFTTNAQGSSGAQLHTYQANGTYPVIVTVTDVNHDSGQATFHVTVTSTSNFAITDPNAVFSVPVVAKPGYLQPIADPVFGTQISRVAGDAGASITTAGGAALGTWSRDARHNYNLNEAWNSDSSLLYIENRAADGGTPGQLYLDGNSYQVKFGTPSNMPGYGNYDQRWNPDPAYPNDVILAGNNATQLYWFNVVTNTVDRSWTLPLRVTYLGITKGNPSQDGRFICLGDLTHFFIVDMASYPTQRLGPVFDLNSLAINGTVTSFSIAPSGHYVVVHYGQLNGQAGDFEQVLKVDPTTLALSPQAMSVSWPGMVGNPSLGFVYGLGHEDMALDPFLNNADVMIGQEHCGNVRTNIPGIPTVNSDGIGHIVMVQLSNGAVTSLTDPGNGSTLAYEAYADHVSCRAIVRPGWCYVSYYNEPGARYTDEIIAVKMDLSSGSVQRLAHYHSDFDNNNLPQASQDSDFGYRSEAHLVPSPDGLRVIFASNWLYQGTGGQWIEDYVIDLHPRPVLAVAGFPSPATAGVAFFSITVTARNASGNTATGYRGTIHFSSSDSQALLPANYTFVASDNGVHTFSVTLKTAGSQSLTVTDTTTASIAGTQSGIVVNPAAASTLTVAGLPSPTTAGVAGTVTVTAKDAYGNTATTYRGTVRFSSSDSQAGLPANYTFGAADNGVHTFSVILKTAGSQSLTVTDTATNSIAGTQAAVAVKPAAATRLRVSGFPAQATAGLAGNFTVTAVDAYGNTATGYSGTIRFTSSDSQAVLPANYTFTASDRGVHVFSATLKTNGSQSLTATDTVANSITGTQTGINVS